MSWGLLSTIIVIAMFDSLNPSLFVVQLYLLTTQRPVPRVLAYIGGVLLANFLGGALVLAGFRALLGDVLRSLDPAWLYGTELVLGAALLGFGVWMRIMPKEQQEARKPRSLSIGHAFVLGTAVMVNELTTALPYFVAIERLTQAGLSITWNVFALVIYNLVFGLPLFGILFAYLAIRGRFLAVIERVNRSLAYWMPRLIKYGSVMFGGALIAHALSFFTIGDILAN